MTLMSFKKHRRKQGSTLSDPLEFWNEAAAKLAAKEYDDICEAVWAVADEVLKRSGMENSPCFEETRGFVFDILSNDPEMIEILKTSLRFRYQAR